MDKWDRFIAELREAAKARALSFRVSKSKGNGGHAVVGSANASRRAKSRDRSQDSLENPQAIGSGLRDEPSMMRSFSYPVLIEPGDQSGFVATFRDVPEAISEGDDIIDPQRMASDALGVALLTLLEMGRPLPKPSAPEEAEVHVSAGPDVCAKIAVIEAFRQSGLTQGEFARRLGKDGREVRRILDPDHATKLPTVTFALATLGRRLIVGVEAA